MFSSSMKLFAFPSIPKKEKKLFFPHYLRTYNYVHPYVFQNLISMSYNHNIRTVKESFKISTLNFYIYSDDNALHAI